MDRAAYKSPESVKNRPQKGSRPGFPENSPGQKPQGVAQPQVAAADAEAQIDPDPGAAQQKQPVRKDGMPGPQRPEEPVCRTQLGPQDQGPQHPGGGQGRGRQRRKRPKMPRLRGSS